MVRQSPFLSWTRGASIKYEKARQLGELMGCHGAPFLDWKSPDLGQQPEHVWRAKLFDDLAV